MNSSNSRPAQTLAASRLLEALAELANLREDQASLERFVKRWPGLVFLDESAYRLKDGGKVPYKYGALVERRGALRNIWRGDPFTLRQLLVPTDPPEELRGKYFNRDCPPDEEHSGVVWDTQIDLDWERGQFVYESRTEFQRALYCLFRQSARAKVCANPECPAPYFIARETTQRYCSDKCAEVIQREYKRRWWSEHGDEWRRSRKRSRRKPRGKH